MRVFTTAEASRLLGISERTMYSWRKDILRPSIAGRLYSERDLVIGACVTELSRFGFSRDVMRAAVRFLADVPDEEFRFGRFVAWWPDPKLRGIARKLPFMLESDAPAKRIIPDNATPGGPVGVRAHVVVNTGKLIEELEREMARTEREAQ